MSKGGGEGYSIPPKGKVRGKRTAKGHETYKKRGEEEVRKFESFQHGL